MTEKKLTDDFKSLSSTSKLDVSVGLLTSGMYGAEAENLTRDSLNI